MRESVHFLRVTLRDVKPVVRRDLVVPSDVHLDRLHQILQVAMGWEDDLLHEFIVGSKRNGEHFGPATRPGAFDFGGPSVNPEKRFTLQQVALRKGSKFLYWYDFGDDWYHDIVVTATGLSQEGEPILRCLDGTGACPPEDCGGPFGYQNLLDALSDPEREDHEESCEWVGDDFDPAAFDMVAVNQALARLETRWKRATRGTRAGGR